MKQENLENSTEELEETLTSNTPLTKAELDFLQAFHGLDAPYTLEEVKKMFPGLYFPVQH